MRKIFKFVWNLNFILCSAVEGFMRKLLAEKAMRPVVIDMTATTGAANRLDTPCCFW